MTAVESLFFRQPCLAQALNDHWRDWPVLQEPFDRELRVEATRLRHGEFRLGVVPLRGLSSRQKGVGKKGPVPRVNCSLKLLNRRVKPTQANLGNAQVRVAEAPRTDRGGLGRTPV